MCLFDRDRFGVQREPGVTATHRHFRPGQLLTYAVSVEHGERLEMRPRQCSVTRTTGTSREPFSSRILHADNHVSSSGTLPPLASVPTCDTGLHRHGRLYRVLLGNAPAMRKRGRSQLAAMKEPTPNSRPVSLLLSASEKLLEGSMLRKAEAFRPLSPPQSGSEERHHQTRRPVTQAACPKRKA